MKGTKPTKMQASRAFWENYHFNLRLISDDPTDAPKNITGHCLIINCSTAEIFNKAASQKSLIVLLWNYLVGKFQ